ncbi:hypothetical protein MF271_06930 [Deinococcus sp. KNUC1210]|uniref:hypothetical protein n=1 Tax=Deinococcus sp. KNUC1210 TaxID=2917691 RepID=UPI001EF0316B|nr:hypothetical protein [Deinococcus sp. KNUC1210]ULH16948.1 hypothetical protein MF271_06930 [Deinococcus sp. KNUC1210]
MTVIRAICAPLPGTLRKPRSSVSSPFVTFQYAMTRVSTGTILLTFTPCGSIH